MDPNRSIKLSNGALMPLVGLGVYQTPPGTETQDAVRWALEAGYRHIDTAAVYRNERDVGKVIKQSGIERRELFVTTKLASGDHGYDKALKAFDQSLDFLGLDKVDLYLVHWPGSPARKSSWKALEKIQNEGRAKAIGVSNYTVAHLKELLSLCTVKPAVNQVEFNPFLNQRELFAFCTENEIQLEAYAPLTQGVKLKHPILVEIATRLQKTPAQVLIRWGIEQKIVVIPKSVRKERIVENFSVFDFTIDEADMKRLGKLNENLRTCWDPSNLP